MAYTSYDTPGEFFGAGYSLTSSEVKLTTNDNGGTKLLTQLTDSDANASTGKTQQVALALIEAVYQKYIAIATADRPSNMSVSRSSSVDDTAGTRTIAYVFSVKVDAATLTTVRPEA
jgi:hypothetical protein